MSSTSVGALYHLITGVTPVGALSRATAVLNIEPDPLRPASDVNHEVTPDVASVLMQAMALDRDRRPSSADLMRSAPGVVKPLDSVLPFGEKATVCAVTSR